MKVYFYITEYYAADKKKEKKTKTLNVLTQKEVEGTSLSGVKNLIYRKNANICVKKEDVTQKIFRKMHKNTFT